MASSAVPFLTPVPIISRSLMCKTLIYWNDGVNWTLVQMCDPGFMWGVSALHRGCVFCSSDGLDRSFRFPAHFDRRMQQLGENFEADDKTRTGAREIAAGIERVNTSVSNGRDVLPANREINGAIFFAGLRCGVSAGRGDQDIRLRGNNIIERDAEGRTARLAKNVVASREVNHARNPVAANVNWLEPLEEGDGRAIGALLFVVCRLYFLFEHAEFFANGFDQLLGGMGVESL